MTSPLPPATGAPPGTGALPGVGAVPATGALPATGTVPEPTPPGKLGEAIDAVALLDYQAALDRWLTDRRAELDRLDGAAQAAERAQADAARAGRAATGAGAVRAGATGDVVLAMTMWESVRLKAEELRTLWDSGRADAIARERMSRVIWGRLDGAPVPGDPASATSTVSLAEATTLVDALIRQLRIRLAFDPDQADLMARLRTVRASLVRSGDLARGDDGVASEVTAAREALERVQANAQRGADVTGPLAELEIRATRTERDAIVAAARRHEAERDAVRAATLAGQLATRATAVAELVARCRAEIAAPPRLAVPDVTRLGPVPTEPEALAAYLTRLESVARAMDTVEDAYATPLRTRASVRFRLQRARIRATATGRVSSPTVTAGFAEADAAVGTTPCDLPLAVDLVVIAEYLAQPLPHTQGAPAPTTPGGQP